VLIKNISTKTYISKNRFIFKPWDNLRHMNKLKRELIWITLSLLAISGCENSMIGGKNYVCLCKSRHADSYLKKSKLIEKKLEDFPTLEDKKEAVHIYGLLGKTELMDKYIKEIIEESKVLDGELYDWIGEQYRKAHKKCDSQIRFLR